MHCYHFQYGDLLFTSAIMVGDGMTDYEAYPPAVSVLGCINNCLLFCYCIRICLLDLEAMLKGKQ